MTEKTRMEYLQEKEKQLREEKKVLELERKVNRLEQEVRPSRRGKILRGMVAVGKKVDGHLKEQHGATRKYPPTRTHPIRVSKKKKKRKKQRQRQDNRSDNGPGFGEFRFF